MLRRSHRAATRVAAAPLAGSACGLVGRNGNQYPVGGKIPRSHRTGGNTDYAQADQREPERGRADPWDFASNSHAKAARTETGSAQHFGLLVTASAFRSHAGGTNEPAHVTVHLEAAKLAEREGRWAEACAEYEAIT